MKRNLIFAVALVVLWCIPAFVFGLQYVLDDFLAGHPVSVWGSMKMGLPRWLIWAPLTPIGVWFARRIGISREAMWRQLWLHLAVVLLLAVPASISWALGPMPGRSRLPVWNYLLIIYPVSLVWTAPLYGAMAGITFAIDARVRSAELERQLVRARLDALHSQLRPHFFFNTLHSIASLIRSNRGVDAVSMIARLGDLVRETLSVDPRKTQPPSSVAGANDDASGGYETTLERELELAKLYLDIQRVRFSDRLRVEFDTDPAVGDALVPPLLLQPLIENAVDHGIASLQEGGTVEIRASEPVAGRLALEIVNTGSLDPRPEGVGLRNTRERLRELYGDAQSLDLRSDAGTVAVRLEIPCRRSKR